jgi:hypothetical protein
MRNNLISLILILSVTPAVAGNKISGDWEYNINASGDAVIVGYKRSSFDAKSRDAQVKEIRNMEELVVPATLDGIPVKGLAAGVFSYPHPCPKRIVLPEDLDSIDENAFLMSDVKQVVLPKNLKTIGKMAFSSCGIEVLLIPDSVTSIGDSAFNSTNLSSVLIPAGVERIGKGAFSNCSKLTNIAVHPDNQNYSSLNGVLFDKDRKIILQYPNGKPSSYTIPSGVVTIEAFAFYGGKNERPLTRVAIPPSVKHIGEHAFQDSGVPAVNLPAGLESIGDSAFLRSGLTEINVPASVTSIGKGALSSCANMHKISVDPANPNYSSLDGVLYDKARKKLLQFPGGRSGEYVVPDGVTSIAERAFEDTKLSRVVVSSSVTSIGKDSFRWNKHLTDIVIPTHLFKSIDSYGIPEKLLAKLKSGKPEND